jgi:8-oxo-dGTP diphosphatase
MPISPFVANLRKKVGHDLLSLPGINAVVLNDRNEILLVHSKETGLWMPIGGQIEPGEEPADAAVREVFEETGVHVTPIRLTGVFDGPDVTYSNGDRVHYLTIAFLCQAVSGEPHVHDDENHDARYFSLTNVPEMKAHHKHSIDLALANRPEAFFLARNA